MVSDNGNKSLLGLKRNADKLITKTDITSYEENKKTDKEYLKEINEKLKTYKKNNEYFRINLAIIITLVENNNKKMTVKEIANYILTQNMKIIKSRLNNNKAKTTIKHKILSTKKIITAQDILITKNNIERSINSSIIKNNLFISNKKIENQIELYLNLEETSKKLENLISRNKINTISNEENEDKKK